MAVETLSPDWEFDRVDDGSQSKKRQGEGCGWKLPRQPYLALAAFLREVCTAVAAPRFRALAAL